MIARDSLFQPARPSVVERRVWERLISRPVLTYQRALGRAGIDQAERYVMALADADYVARYEEFGEQMCQLRRHYGPLAPAVTANGFLYDGNIGRFFPVTNPTQPEIHVEPPATSSSEGKLWLAARVMRHFSMGDLVATTELPRDAVLHWLAEFQSFGYVRQSGTDYRLIRDTGKRSPLVIANLDMMFDFNTRRYISRQGKR